MNIRQKIKGWEFGRILSLAACIMTILTFTSPASAALSDSKFEIDGNANLVNDGGGLLIDWADVAEERQVDVESGSGDDAFGQGAKEDTEGPTVVSGSIPPNKSDLKTFGVYLEDNGPGERFLHVFWTRVQDPSGTTLMDFEFNQSTSPSGNGITPARTRNDLLVQYELTQGGTVPMLYVSKWLTSAGGDSSSDCEASNKLPCWSTRNELTGSGLAVGSINSSAIADGDSDGLGPLSPRTFGEATVDFEFLAGTTNQGCTNFGSSHLKSRSSDSFTAALKDFIAPKSINVSNCAGIKIYKQDDLDEAIDGVKFNLFKESGDDPTQYNVGQDTSTTYTCTTSGGFCLINNILAGTYWIVEDSTTVPSGFDPVSAPQKVVITAGANVPQEFTFTNAIQRGRIEIDKVTVPAGSTQLFTFNPSWKSSFTLTDGSAKNVTTMLLPSSYGTTGNYSVSESPQLGWTQTSAACVSSIDDGNTNPAAIALRANETVTCTFTNTISPGKIKVDKVTDPSGSTRSFDFSLTGTGVDQSFSLTDASALYDSGSLLPSSENGTYSLAETPLSDWDQDSASCDDSSPIDAIDVSPGEIVTCTFYNSIKPGKIVVDKVVTDPTGSTESFNFTLTGTPVAQNFPLTDAATPYDSGDLLPSSESGGNYSVAETVPDYWKLDSAVCVSSIDGANTNPAAITLRANETVTCTFSNSVKRGAILITKTRKHAADGSGDHAHAGVTFTTSGGSLTSDDSQQTDSDGQICVGNLILSGMAGIGDYSVAETVPDGYVADGDATKTVSVTQESVCGDGNEATVSFGNIPLTDITVSVNSQVDGGTYTTISCTGPGDSDEGQTTTTGDGDGMLNVNNKQPGIYICTIDIDP